MATTKVSTKLLETVGVAEGGTGATSASAARTSLGLVIGTNVLAPGGDGSSLTGIAGGATDSEKANIMLNAFRISVVGSLSVQNMVDGVVDEFEDETGVDTSTSTNETYDATKDLYSGAVITTEGTFAQANYDLGDFGDGTTAKSEGLMFPNTNAGTVISVKQDYSSVVTSANVKASLWTNSGGPNTQVGGDSVAVNVITTGEWTFTWPSSAPVLSASTDYWVVFTDQSSTGSFTTRSVADQGASYASGNNNVITSITGPGMTGKGGDLKVEIKVSQPNNMTLVSNATTALAAPDDANIVIWQQDVDSVTLNTDLKAYASRNGGTTYTQMTLSEKTSIPVVGEGYTSDVIPTMTSHTAPSGTASASYERSGYPAWKALDDDITTIGNNWDARSTFPRWIAYEFSSPKVISRYTLRPSDEPGQMAASWTFEGWTGSAWVVLDTQTNAASWTSWELRVFDISNTTLYIKYKINVTAGILEDRLKIGEWEMMESTISSTRILSGSVDISGQSSGTSMKYKIETLNTKEQRIHAVALQWS